LKHISEKKEYIEIKTPRARKKKSDEKIEVKTPKTIQGKRGM
jgi:hypothetical protein